MTTLFSAASRHNNFQFLQWTPPCVIDGLFEKAVGKEVSVCQSEGEFVQSIS